MPATFASDGAVASVESGVGGGGGCDDAAKSALVVLLQGEAILSVYK
jgi:hypothetical protein